MDDLGRSLIVAVLASLAVRWLVNHVEPIRRITDGPSTSIG